ncbi:type II toxin-antitoxin system RelE/ParE family toxin [Candidatus Thiodictyon syntrophicum]|jgi:toxin ParE1/3/4|uniref:Plasmid stabilization protein n=1 Tax=Candidatus Thiodictyon syntrophicum TaxID=1166950 RepID=A0A2K8U5Z5_9GAMM|nr:type II toxin-antitoxin system RelE/ParE family toxin [Candidatus Thiodictyon syntrophicum]AUB80977.1 plasmid stabilization protein [Candidatus Thiodictyon syntrophicum]
MPVIRRTARAEDDLVDIWIYIARDNPDAADRLLEEIDRKCVLLAENPRLGRARPDIAPEFRHWPIGSYLILYRLLPDGIEVVRVVHGARRLDRLL